MKKLFFLFAFLPFLQSCGDGNVLVQVDPNVRLTEDIQKINDFFIRKGFTADQIDTTALGVRYVIIELGSTPTVQESNIVSFDYIGMLLNDTIFDTSIPEIADSIRNVEGIGEIYSSSFPETRDYEEFQITYSQSGWTVAGNFIEGFNDGISKTFNQIGVGGRVLIAMPSELAYGTPGSGLIIGPNTPLSFELILNQIESQE